MPKSTSRKAWVYYSREDKLGRRYAHERKFIGKDQVSANTKAKASLKSLRRTRSDTSTSYSNQHEEQEKGSGSVIHAAEGKLQQTY